MGHAKKLIDHIISDPTIKNIKKFLLITTNAHGLYEQFGFKPLSFPERL